MSLWTRGVVVLLLLGAAGCSSSELPPLSRADAEACAELTAALPDRVDGEDLSDDTDRTASWGGIELTCGAEMPASYDEFASCTELEDVGWFLPPAELNDPSSDILVTALTHSPRVSVLIPAAHRGNHVALSEISPAITKTLTEGEPCL